MQTLLVEGRARFLSLSDYIWITQGAALLCMCAPAVFVLHRAIVFVICLECALCLSNCYSAAAAAKCDKDWSGIMFGCVVLHKEITSNTHARAIDHSTKERYQTCQLGIAKPSTQQASLCGRISATTGPCCHMLRQQRVIYVKSQAGML